MADRGIGWIYMGTVHYLNGHRVVVMDDCTCEHCALLDAWDESRRVEVTLDTGERLIHARCSSFQKPLPN